MKISVIIPAYNEQGRIKEVLSVVTQCTFLHEIIVVNDGSTDGTSNEAKEYSVLVVDLPYNQGKWNAIKEGISHCTGEWLLLLDADLRGLTKKHIGSLIEGMIQNKDQSAIGIFVKGNKRTDLSHRIFPFLSGQRVMKKEILEQMMMEYIPYIKQVSFGIETAITLYSRKMGIKTMQIPLPYVCHVTKEEKMGWRVGFLDRWNMYFQIIQTYTSIQVNTLKQFFT